MKDEKKGIGIYIPKNIYESVVYISKNLEYTTKTGYLKNLILNDIKKRIEEGNEELKNIFNSSK